MLKQNRRELGSASSVLVRLGSSGETLNHTARRIFGVTEARTGGGVECVIELVGPRGRESDRVADDHIMILTAGGDGASKGAQEVMQALALIDAEAPDWRYVCKVWPQARTVEQNLIDLDLAAHLGIGKKVAYSTNVVSQALVQTRGRRAMMKRCNGSSRSKICSEDGTSTDRSSFGA
jgi:hypothetical protein